MIRSSVCNGVSFLVMLDAWSPNEEDGPGVYDASPTKQQKQNVATQQNTAPLGRKGAICCLQLDQHVWALFLSLSKPVC